MDDNNNRLLHLAKEKTDTEERLYNRIEALLRLGTVLYWLIGAIAGIAIWAYALQHQANYNTNALKQLWQEMYGVPLPLP